MISAVHIILTVHDAEAAREEARMFCEDLASDDAVATFAEDRAFDEDEQKAA